MEDPVSSFLLGLLAGMFVSIPLGPFGIWAIHIYIREGWRSAITVAVGGVLGDIAVLFVYLGWGLTAEYLFSVNLEHSVRDFFGNGLVRGCTLFAVGIFLMLAAGWEHKPRSNQTKFLASFIGAINPLNAPAIGFILSRLGVQDASMHGHFIAITLGFSIGAFVTWMACMWGFSHLHFLRMTIKFNVLGTDYERSVLTLLLFCAGIVSFSIGIGFILQHT